MIQARRTLFAVVFLAAACGGPRIPRQTAATVIESASAFKTPKVVYLPRQVAIPANGLGNSLAARQGEALTLIEIASVDPVVGVLRARDWVTIEDFVSAVPGSVVEMPPAPVADSTKPDSSKAPNDSTKAPKDSTKPDQEPPKRPPPKATLDQPHTSPPPAPPLAQQWVHTLRVTPRPNLQSSDLAPDDGEDTQDPRITYGGLPVARTPGWTLAIGAREFIRVLNVLAYSPAHGEPAGEAQVDFLWHWRPTKVGDPFDTESAEFESLPREVQQAALTGSITMDGSTHWSRATLARDGKAWKVTHVDWTYGDDKPHTW